MKISALRAYEILDSRGNPTVYCQTILSDGSTGAASVPSGASTGAHEACELRDGDEKRFHGLGVSKAVVNINEKINKLLNGYNAADQEAVDTAMIGLDGTANKSNLGANALLAVSLSVARAQSISEKKELFEYLTGFNPAFSGTYRIPLLQVNILNGGKHADKSTDIQEFMVIPVSADSVYTAVRLAAEIYQNLKKLLKGKGLSVNIGDEGGFVPQMSSNFEPLEMICEAIRQSGLEPGKDIVLGIDAAASEFFDNGKYELKKENKSVDFRGLSEFYEEMIRKFPVWNLEDIFAENDWQAFADFNSLHHDKYQLTGDDLYCTNTQLLQKGITMGCSGAIIIKPNQIGTLTETIKAIHLARKNNIEPIISHRSGETEDTFIADLSVAMGTGQIKTGATARGERTAKYNRLVQIQAKIENNFEYVLPESLKKFISG